MKTQIEQHKSDRSDRIQTNMIGRTVWIRDGKDEEGKDIYHSSEVVDVFLKRDHEGYESLAYTITYSGGYSDGRTCLLEYNPHHVLLTKPEGGKA